MKTKIDYAAPETEVILLMAEQTVMAGSGEYTDNGIEELINHDWN